VIPAEEIVAKLRAAVDARTDPDFVLIARTDALAVEGVDAAIDRARRYADAGADILWIEAPDTEQELEKIAEQLDGHTLVLNWLEGGRTPAIDIDRIRKMKFALVLFPIGSVLAMASALREHLAYVKARGTPAGRLDKLSSFDDFTDIVDLREIGSLEQRYR
jgi:2,3-dimethylmalate lyase